MRFEDPIVQQSIAHPEQIAPMNRRRRLTVSIKVGGQPRRVGQMIDPFLESKINFLPKIMKSIKRSKKQET
jgi:hypothetical protein